MKWNGFLVTTATRNLQIQRATDYRGVAYGVAWPLAYCASLSPTEEFVISLTDSIMDNYQVDEQELPLRVIADIEFVRSYMEYCAAYDIETRLLICSSLRGDPVIDEPTYRMLEGSADFIGFDYAYSSLDFSALYSDMTPPASKELARLSDRLNRFGLFDSYEDVIEYTRLRWELIRASNEITSTTEDGQMRISLLEDTGDFVIIGVFERSQKLLEERSGP